MLSIVIPVRDEEEAILEVLRKAAALDLDHEILVIDDGSRDKTAVIAEESGARKDRRGRSSLDASHVGRDEGRESSDDQKVKM